MDDSNTMTFVLGAGASSHYGYPLGSELVEAMNTFVRSMPDDSPPIVYDARDFLDRVIAFNPLNIDYYLHNNPSDEKIGSSLIEAVIKYTQHSHIYSYSGQKAKWWRSKAAHRTPFAGASNKDIESDGDIRRACFYAANWVKFIHQRVVAGAREGSEIEDIKAALGNIKIVTFNYDLSFEHALYAYFAKSSIYSEICSFLEESFFKNNVIHVYGEISHNGFECPDFKEKEALQVLIRSSGDYLNVISPFKTKEVDKIASGMITSAKNLYFLGYAFDDFNNNRLGLAKVTQEDCAKIGALNRNWKIQNVYYTNMGDHLIPDSKVRSFFDGRAFETYGADSRIKQAFWIDENSAIIDRSKKTNIIKSTKNVYDALEQDLHIPIID